MKKVCFFAHVPDSEYFEICEFYNNDIRILQGLGFDTVLCNKVADLPFIKADWYYSWFYGWALFPMIMAKFRGKKHICCGNIHTGEGLGLSGWPFVKQLLMKTTMCYSDVSIFTSQTEVKRLDGYSPKKTKMIYHGIDFDRYHDKNNPRKGIVLSVTHLTKDSVQRKRLLDCLTAFSKVTENIPEAHYIICGSYGDGLKNVKDKIHELSIGEKVTLKGRISVNEKISLLQSSKVYLQPTTCEGFGLALVEAQACGLPVITTMEPCVLEVNAESVLYSDTIADMAYDMKMLLTNEQYWRTRSELSCKNALRYSYSKRRDEMEKMLIEENILDSRC